MNIVVAEIKSVKKHPDAQKLSVCEVFDGTQTVQVVCGAQNVRAGMKSVLAKVGSTTPKGLVIKEAKLRGVDSHGMLCSARDLDVNNEDGIVDLPLDIQAGTDWKAVSTDQLSSTPWHLYEVVDSMWENSKSKNIQMFRGKDTPSNKAEFQLMSMTFFKDGQYLYRHFKQ